MEEPKLAILRSRHRAKLRAEERNLAQIEEVLDHPEALQVSTEMLKGQ